MRAEPNEGWEPREPGEPQTKSIRAGVILFGEEENKYLPGRVPAGIRFPRFPRFPPHFGRGSGVSCGYGAGHSAVA